MEGELLALGTALAIADEPIEPAHAKSFGIDGSIV